jgi:hypothetical protein
MKLPAYAVRIILALIFLAAAGVRFSSTSESKYQYFKGESAATYNDAISVSTGNFSKYTVKSNWPEGYRPDRVRPTGVPYIAGVTLRVSRWLSDTDARTTIRRLWVFVFCLCIFTVYRLTYGLWRSQTAQSSQTTGLLAAFLVAFYAPVVNKTNGAELDILVFVLPFVIFHLAALRRLAGGKTKSGLAGLAASAAMILFSWELASYYVVACVLTATFLYPLDSRQRRLIAVVHLVVFILVAMLSPWARAVGLGFSWQAAVLTACCLQTFLSYRYPGVRRGGLFVVVVGALLTAALTPLRSGAEADLPTLEYFYNRIRFLVSRPMAPSLLPDAVRHWWTADHAPPSAHALLTFFIPVFFIGAASVLAARSLVQRGKTDGGPESLPGSEIVPKLVLAAAAALAGCMVYLFDRGSITPALIAMIPFLGLSGLVFDNRSGRTTGVTTLGVGMFLVLIQLLWPLGRIDPALRVAQLLGVAHRDKTDLMWVSLENTDLSLVKFVATRTRTPDPILGRPEPTTLLQAFSGRTSVLLAAGKSRVIAGKHVEVTRLMYGGEERLYRYCRDNEIKYVLYSIDYLLDTTRYSPLYLAGYPAVPDSCVTVTMHFSPEQLVRFNLVYENDFYRLFRVAGKPEPIFSTDHPLVYQREIFSRNADTYDSFRDRIGQIIYGYSEAIQFAATGRYETALNRLTWCLQQAPHFTRARVAAGSVFLQMDQPQQALDVLETVIQYAPDNPDALYLTADALARLENRADALAFLEILYTVTQDQDLLDRARLLEALIKRGAPAGGNSSMKSIFVPPDTSN